MNKLTKLMLALMMLAIPVSFALATPTKAPQEANPFPLLRTAANTGYTGTLTAYTGSLNLTTANATYEDLIFPGRINIKANNITISNCLIELAPGPGGDGESYGLVNVDFLNGAGYYTGLVVKDCEFIGGKSSSILVSQGSFIRCNFHTTGADAIKAKGCSEGDRVLIKNCYIHDIGRLSYNTITNAHSDGTQIRRNGSATTGTGGDLHFIGCNFDLYPLLGNSLYVAPNACAIVQTAEADGIFGEVLFKDCYLGGGNFVMYFTDKGAGYGNVDDWNLIDNVWRANEWVSGPLTFDGPIGTITGNRRLDTGVPCDALLDGATNTW
tara:strand:- start:65 stop:1039 length:975 start_codon:yes stop_codon:yes gene_type:complete